MRVRRITQVFTPVDLTFPGFGRNFRVFQRFLRVFRLRFNFLWIEWFRTRSCHRCYPCLYGREQNIGMVTSTLRVTPFSGFSVTQSRPRGKSLACWVMFESLCQGVRGGTPSGLLKSTRRSTPNAASSDDYEHNTGEPMNGLA